MRVSLLDFSASRLRLLRFGSGERLLIALHGFGDKAELFAPPAKALGTEYTVIAFDLPFHGETEWRQNVFSKTDLAFILRQIMAAEGRERRRTCPMCAAQPWMPGTTSLGKNWRNALNRTY